jgi:hypothetical protein
MTVLRLWSDFHGRTPIDVFMYEPFLFAQEYIVARWEKVGEGLKTPVVRRETLIATKRSGARPQDLADIAELVRRAHAPHRGAATNLQSVFVR